MNLTTSLVGRVRNTPLPKSQALLPVMEALVNGLQAVDVRFPSDLTDGCIRIQVIRSPQQAAQLDGGPGRPALEPIIGFVVEDNGEGFTEANMTSFQTLDSEYKSGLGCRGVGRLSWLKAFDRVEVSSVCEDGNGEKMAREFTFDALMGVVQTNAEATTDAPRTTSVRLVGFKEEYQRHALKSAEAIAKEVFEHCLLYFLRSGGAPRITLVDDSEAISLNDMFIEFAATDLEMHHLVIKGESFDLACLRARSAAGQTPRMYWAAASRAVMNETLSGKISGLYGRLRDEKGDFTFLAFLTSDYLDRSVRADRTGFEIVDKSAGTLTDDEISLSDLRAEAFAKIGELLEEALGEGQARGRERVSDFVSTTAPRYRPVLARFEKSGLSLDPGLGDKELELQLHRYLRDFEVELIAEGHAVLEDVSMGMDEKRSERLQDYLAKVDEMKKSDLAAYVFRRKVVIELLAELIRFRSDGTYSLEESVHSLLMPMRHDSNEVSPDASNLWIIDERLAFHDYLASDKTLKSIPITGSMSHTEPDLLATRLVGTPFLVSEGEDIPSASISVIEIKRPMRNDGNSEEKDPIRQALKYLDRVRKGGVLTAKGRPIPASESIPGFCYVIADLTPSMIESAVVANLEKTYDGLGYFGFNRQMNTYIEVISFDKLLRAAKERNRAFFDKLGLPI